MALRPFTPTSAEPTIVIHFDNGTQHIILDGGPSSGDLLGQAIAFGTLGRTFSAGMAGQSGTAALRGGVNGVAREVAVDLTQNSVDAATGLPISTAAGFIPGGKRVNFTGSAPSSGYAARSAAIRDALTDANGRLLSAAERQGIK